MTSTIQKGNAFRNLVASMLQAASFAAETETRERFQKVDVRWRREDLDGPLKYVVEAKDHAGTRESGGISDTRPVVRFTGGSLCRSSTATCYAANAFP
jgi:hypothetical protein